MWRDEKVEYLKDNRNYSHLLQERTENSDLVLSKYKQENLIRRQKLDEILSKNRNKDKFVKIDSSTKAGNSNRRSNIQQPKKELPYDRSFGSFFGPSEPIVARRVLEADRNREVKQATQSKPVKQVERRVNTASKPIVKPKPSKPPSKIHVKAQKLKEARDYSFLFSEGDNATPTNKTSTGRPANGNFKERRPSTSTSAKLPAPKVGAPSKPVSNSAARSSSSDVNRSSQPASGNLKSLPSSKPSGKPPVPSMAKGQLPKSTSTVSKPTPMVSRVSVQKRPAPMVSRVSVEKRPPTDSRLSQNGRTTMERRPTPVERRPMENGRTAGVKRPLDNGRTSIDKKVTENARGATERRLPQQKPMISKSSSSRPVEEVRRPAVPPKRFQRDESPDSFLDDDDDTINYRSFLPKQFRLRGNYDEDGYDSSDMEADFRTIQEEEARSARIARREDEEALKLIMEEERQERLRKKRRKS